MKLIKPLLLLLNIIFMISGVILILSATFIDELSSKYSHFIGNSLVNGSVILTCVGSIIFFVCFWGCCGIIGDSNSLVLVYSACLSALVILEFYAGVSASLNRAKIKDTISSSMRESMLDYNHTDSVEVTLAWDELQSRLGCCGTQNFMDWNKTEVWTRYGSEGAVPDSCCKVIEANCGSDIHKFINTEGCLDSFSTNIKQENVLLVGGAAMGIAFIQIIGVIFSCFLAKKIRIEEKEELHYKRHNKEKTLAYSY